MISPSQGPSLLRRAVAYSFRQVSWLTGAGPGSFPSACGGSWGPMLHPDHSGATAADFNRLPYSPGGHLNESDIQLFGASKHRRRP